MNLCDLSTAAAMAIYRRDYWQKISGDQLPAGPDLMVFDHAVNAGIGGSVRLLQEALEVPADGDMGPRTLGAARLADARDLILRLSRRQTEFYQAGPDSSFKPGWLRRVALRTHAALAMLGQQQAAP